MAKLNATQTLILESVKNFREGSRGLVKSFEVVVSDYWGKDSCNPANIEFFVNAIKRFPQLQKAVINDLLPRMAKLTIKMDKDNTSADKKEKAYTVVNWKPNAEKGEVATTKEEKVAFRTFVKSFIEAEHTSLLHDKKTVARTEKSYDLEKSAKSIRSSIQSQIQAAIEGGANIDVLRNMALKAVSDMFAADNVRELRNKAEKKAA